MLIINVTAASSSVTKYLRMERKYKIITWFVVFMKSTNTNDLSYTKNLPTKTPFIWQFVDFVPRIAAKVFLIIKY